jgi:hypothetical protein
MNGMTFGIAEGGDLIELGKNVCITPMTYIPFLTMIERDSTGLVKEKKQEVRPSYTSVEDDMIDLRVMPLRNYALTSYLQSRGVDIGIATTFCKEIHYTLRQKKYFAIAFPNKSGGFEVRNPLL